MLYVHPLLRAAELTPSTSGCCVILQMRKHYPEVTIWSKYHVEKQQKSNILRDIFGMRLLNLSLNPKYVSLFLWLTVPRFQSLYKRNHTTYAPNSILLGVHTWRGQRLMVHCSTQILMFLRQGLSLNWELISLARMASLWTLLPLPFFMDYRYTLLHPEFYMSAKDQNSGPNAWTASILPGEHLSPQPLSCTQWWAEVSTHAQCILKM